jgi:uncharacterized membrane-anchored protein YhcB (DUF1043 family)
MTQVREKRQEEKELKQTNKNQLDNKRRRTEHRGTRAELLPLMAGPAGTEESLMVNSGG